MKNFINHGRRFSTFDSCIILLLLSLPSLMAQPAPPFRHDARTPYPNFKPSMAVTVTILAAAFVVIALFALYIRRCSRDTNVGASIRGLAARSRRAPRGLDPTVIDTFPTFAYSVVKGLKIGKGTLECAVCLNEFEDDETLRLLPKCDHVFHPECIDAWLGSHTTCPVCRANLELVPLVSNEQSGGGDSIATTATTEVFESGNDSETVIRSPDSESQEQVLIRVYNDSAAEGINLSQIPNNKPVRSKSTKPRRFPRSHSTGHSLVQPGENLDRFTLKLPEDVRKEIVNGKLNRSASCVTFATRQGSGSGSRHGYYRSGGGGEEGGVRDRIFGRFSRSGKSDRWGFSMAPPFFWRNPSVRASKKGGGGDGAVKSTLGPKTDESEHSMAATRPPV